jgi:hypothetical protein
MAKQRREQLEERLRNEARNENLFGSLSGLTKEELTDAIREVALPAIDREKQQKEAKQRAPISLPPLSPSPISHPLLRLSPITSLRRLESSQEILERARKRRRNTPDASRRFDENIGKMMHEEREKRKRAGYQSKRPRGTPPLPKAVLTKIENAADAVDEDGAQLYPLKDVLPKKVWEKIAGRNMKLGGTKPKLSTFQQLLRNGDFKNAARARFNRAATYYAKNIAPHLSRV